MEINKKNWLLKVFLIFYLLFAILTYQDYGITWDEKTEYDKGKALLSYWQKEINYSQYAKKMGNFGKYYSHFYAAVLKLFNSKNRYESYHLLNIIFALPVFLASYFIFNRVYKRPTLAILGPIFLFLTPRFLGHLPGNPKDVPFAVIYFLSLAAIFTLQSSKKTFLKIIILGFFFGLSQTLRLIGFSLYLILFLYDLYLYPLTKKPKLKLGKFLAQEAILLFAVLTIASLFMVATWPYLKEDFFRHGWEILNTAKTIPWKGFVLFTGKFIYAPELPSQLSPAYLLIWLLITTPVFILFFYFSSLFFIKKWLKNKIFVLLGLAFLINFFFYAFFRPVIYDGLRHFLFLLPLLSAIAAISFIEFLKNFRSAMKKNLILVLTGLNIIFLIIRLVQLYPYQYIYFNELTLGLRGANGLFDTDYYGASFKEATEWLIKNEITDPKKVYKIKTCGHPFSSTYYFKANMNWVEELEKADYFICYTRFNQHLKAADKQVIHIVEREEIPLNYVIKLK